MFYLNLFGTFAVYGGDRPSAFQGERSHYFYGNPGIATSGGHYAHTSARPEVGYDDYTPDE
jgi:hypothetical protein